MKTSVIMTKRNVSAVLALLLTLVLGTATALAQKNRDDSNTRLVQGVVSDNGGSPVQGAVVQLKDTKTLQVRSFYTQKDGRYHFAGLSTNVDYELKAEKDGAASGTKTLSVFDSRKTAIVDLKLNK
jgi:hypothetical protein